MTNAMDDTVVVKADLLEREKINTMAEFSDPMDIYHGLVQRVKKYHPSGDISLIEKAFNIASEAHKSQFRKSGEPYIIHPLSVAMILAELELDKETIVAGILHDVVEDTVLTDKEITELFGADVALLVDGVTKLKQLKFTSANGDKSTEKLEMQAENLRKMFLAMAKDIRVILIKLADRLHNMRTLKHMPKSGFTIEGHYNGQDYKISRPVAGMYGVHIEFDYCYIKPEPCVQISVSDDTFVCFPNKRNVVMKLLFATEELYKVEMEEREKRREQRKHNRERPN